MATQFIKGFTNNHLTFVMVDATDFATPESALSGAIKVMVHGKLKSSSLVHFVSSGTGSMAGGEIKHVGASATGVYTVALVKADLSDASAAWYDQYICTMTATGAAQQVIIADGGIWISDLSAIASDIRSDLSDMHSDLIVMSDVLSNVYSACTALSDAVSNVYSLLSDVGSDVTAFQSDFQSRVPKRVATDSQLSALHSDLDSTIVSQASDLKSAIAAGPGATITASDMSDIVSRVWAAKFFGTDAHNVASSFGSMFRVQASTVSDVDSMLTAMSDILSDVNALAVLIQADTSNIASRVTGAVATASDVASKVWAEKYTAAGNNGASTFGSLMRVQASTVSDIDSMLTDMSNVLSDFYSDFGSRVPKRVATDSQLSALHSDLDSTIVSQASDLKSAVAAVTATISTSDMSDIVSRVWSAKYFGAAAHNVASSFGSMLRVQASSVSDIGSMLTDMSNVLSDLQSDFQSRVPKRVATDSQLSALHSDLDSTIVSQASDLKSAIAAGAPASISASDMSDIVSKVWSAKYLGATGHNVASSFGSMFRVQASSVSDIQSLLSDVSSDIGVISGIQSDTLSALAAGVTVATGGIASTSFAAGAIDAAALATSAVNEIRDAILPAKNTALANVEFLMVLTSDHVSPATGLTVTGERSLDGGAFGAVTGTIAEVSNGIYQLDASAADMNATIVTFRFTSATADDTFLTIKTGG